VSCVAGGIIKSRLQRPSSRRGRRVVLARSGSVWRRIFTPCFSDDPTGVVLLESARRQRASASVFRWAHLLFRALDMGVTALARPIGISQLGGNSVVNAFIGRRVGQRRAESSGRLELPCPRHADQAGRQRRDAAAISEPAHGTDILADGSFACRAVRWTASGVRLCRLRARSR